jgi:chemotaxis protein MotB
LRKKPQKKENSERWLLTYSDLITLLMIFFVTMYAMSTTDMAKYKALSESFSVALGGGKEVLSTSNGVGNAVAVIESKAPTVTDKPKATDNPTAADNAAATEEDLLSGTKKELDQYFKENGLQGTVVTEINERGLVISLFDAALFDSGDSNLKNDAKPTIIQIGKIVNKLSNLIKIEGHTDNVPINTSMFKSNWELSVSRATNVAELLMDSGSIPSEKICITGYGQYRPIADNSTEAGRAKNRRVNIVVLSTKLNASEGNKQ